MEEDRRLQNFFLDFVVTNEEFGFEVHGALSISSSV
jgi:hypothetical protein